MRVKATHPLYEEGRDYKPGDEFDVAPNRGWRLHELGLVEAPPIWDPQAYTTGTWAHDWKSGLLYPSTPAFRTRRAALDDLLPGEKLLLVRRIGGLGDVLVQSQLFPMLHDQHPHVEVHYAVPRHYWSLFDGAEHVTIVDPFVEHSRIGQNYADETTTHGLVPTVLETYNLIEDISHCCAEWERLLMQYRVVDGARTLRWRDRLDVWAHWFGLRVENPRTCIVIRDEERAHARERYARAGASGRKPVLLFAPFSADDKRCYPWFRDIVIALRDRWDVLYLHDEHLPANEGRTLAGLSLREMLACVAEADAVVAVDTAQFHMAGILRRPVIGLFTFLDGAESRGKYYPTARIVQCCSHPCIGYRHRPNVVCPYWTKGMLPLNPFPRREFFRCYHPDSVNAILAAVEALS